MGLFDRAIAGDQSALARIATLVENDNQEAIAALEALGSPERAAHVVGITGPPGVGKSSLINRLLAELRKDNTRIAVLLVDPSSQATGGAVLGDRVRMLAWGDPDVFVRSQASRGQEGGLAPSTATLIDLFVHMGFDLVLIETVGVGQDAIDIRTVCDTTIVLQSPHLGDSVQALKAGILEIADIFVVTKSDLAGARQAVRDLNAMLHMSPLAEGGWTIPVISISSTEETGFEALASKIAAHREYQSSHPEIDSRSARLRWEITKRAFGRVATASRQTESWINAGTRDARTRALLEAALDGLPSHPVTPVGAIHPEGDGRGSE
jgi:LAO/AO transport system kinase